MANPVFVVAVLFLYLGYAKTFPRMLARDHQDDMTCIGPRGFRSKPSICEWYCEGAAPNLYTFVKDMFFVARFLLKQICCFFRWNVIVNDFFWHFGLQGFKSV